MTAIAGLADLSDHVDGIAVDLFVLPTITFRLLYCLVILRHGRRLWVSFGVTTNPPAEWISRQITEAFPWDSAPSLSYSGPGLCVWPDLPLAGQECSVPDALRGSP